MTVGKHPDLQDSLNLLSLSLSKFQDSESSNAEYREASSCALRASEAAIRLPWPDPQYVPADAVAKAMSSITRELGPGDILVRNFWLSVMSSVGTDAQHPGTRLLIDFLPSAATPSIKGEVLELLGRISHPATLSSDLSRLIKFEVLTSVEVSRFCVDFVNNSPRRSLDSAVKCLLSHLGNKEDYILTAVDAIRRRILSIHTSIGDIDGTVRSVAAVLHENYKAGENVSFFKQFVAVLEECIMSNQYISCTDEGIHSNQAQGHAGLSTLDIIVLLITRHCQNCNSEYVLDLFCHNDMLLPHLGTFWGNIALERKTMEESSHQLSTSFVEESMIWMSVFLFCFPLRHPELDIRRPLQRAQRLTVGMLKALNHPERKRFLSALFDLDLELVAVDRRLAGGLKGCPKRRSINMAISEAIRKSIVQSKQESNDDTNFVANQVTPSPKPVSFPLAMLAAHEAREPDWSFMKLTRASSRDPFCECRSLSSSWSSTIRSQELTTRAHRAILGLELASFLVKVGHFQQASEARLIFSFLRLFLPPLRTGLLHPEMAAHVLEILTYPGLYTLSARKELFDTVENTIAAFKLIQYEDMRKKSCLSSKAGNIAGAIDTGRQVSPICQRGMCFSLGNLPLSEHILDPSSWKLYYRWTYRLISTYLEIGRSIAKERWNPSSWLHADFEIPFFLEHLGGGGERRRRRFRKSAKDFWEDFDGTSSPPYATRCFARDLVNAIGTWKTSEYESLRIRLFAFSLSHCIGLAISVAILNNALDPEAMSSGAVLQRQALNVRIFLRKCQALESLFRSTLSARTNLMKPKGRKENSKRDLANMKSIDELSKFEEISHQLQSMTDMCDLSDIHVKRRVWWNSLLDKSHDDLILRALSGESPMSDLTTTERSDLERVVDLRLFLLHHLSRHMQQHSIFQRFLELSCIGRIMKRKEIPCTFIQILKLATRLSLRLGATNHLKEHLNRTEGIMNLTAAYFRFLLLFIMVDPESTYAGPSGDVTFLMIYQRVFEDENLLVDRAFQNNLRGRTWSTSTSPAAPLLRHVGRCQNQFVASELLETLSFFALHAGDGKMELDILEMNWEMLLSNILPGKAPLGWLPPYAFMAALKTLAPSALENADYPTPRDKILQASILRIAFSTPRMVDKHTFLVFNLLRHWGLLAMIERESSVFHSHLQMLEVQARNFLGGTNRSTPTSHLTCTMRTADDDPEYEQRLPHDDLIPVLSTSGKLCLDVDSFPTFFLVVLCMTVAAFALFNINTINIQNDRSPFGQLAKLAEVYRALIQLYSDFGESFPQQTRALICSFSLCMLDAVSYQAFACVSWRNSRPSQSLKHDQDSSRVAPITILLELLDIFQTKVLKPVEELGEQQTLECLESKGGIEDATPGSAQSQQTRKLCSKAATIARELQDIATAHQMRNTNRAIDGDDKNTLAWKKRKRPEVVREIPPIGFTESQGITASRAETNGSRSKITLSRETRSESDFRSTDEWFQASGDWCSDPDSEYSE